MILMITNYPRKYIFIQFLLMDELNIMIDNIYIMDNAFDV